MKVQDTTRSDRSRVRLAPKRSLRRRDIGHNSNGSEIVVSASASPGQSAILTQLRYESGTFFLRLLLSSFPLQEASPSSSLVSLGHAFVFASVSLRRERRVRVRFPTRLLANHFAPLRRFSCGERALTMLQRIIFIVEMRYPFASDDSRSACRERSLLIFPLSKISRANLTLERIKCHF